jgi:hypothetical protein
VRHEERALKMDAEIEDNIAYAEAVAAASSDPSQDLDNPDWLHEVDAHGFRHLGMDEHLLEDVRTGQYIDHFDPDDSENFTELGMRNSAIQYTSRYLGQCPSGFLSRCFRHRTDFMCALR